MCSPGDTVPVEVTVVAGLASEGRDARKVKPIDRCIASIVQALEAGGVYMLGSCCGHGERNGEIPLADGRIIRVQPDPGV